MQHLLGTKSDSSTFWNCFGHPPSRLCASCLIHNVDSPQTLHQCPTLGLHTPPGRLLHKHASSICTYTRGSSTTLSHGSGYRTCSQRLHSTSSLTPPPATSTVPLWHRARSKEFEAIIVPMDMATSLDIPLHVILLHKVPPRSLLSTIKNKKTQ